MGGGAGFASAEDSGPGLLECFLFLGAVGVKNRFFQVSPLPWR